MSSSEASPLLRPVNKHHRHHEYGRKSIFRHNLKEWVPSARESSNQESRPWRRRLFLLITEPETSFLSACFYVFLIVAIFASIILMILQTMEAWQYTPTDCRSCGGDVTYFFEDDDGAVEIIPETECVCPPEPEPFTKEALDALMWFFAIEWLLRIALFVPGYSVHSYAEGFVEWIRYLTSTSTLLDALAIFPYFLESSLPKAKGLVSLRLIRVFRIVQVLRLGQYNAIFMTLTNVFAKSLNHLRLLVLILAFGAAFFGSLMYWMEKGVWKYHEESQQYRFLRTGVDGITEEPSPFGSIPDAFWWFLVTATTVGYGDVYPTSTAGKLIATCAMLMGVLVIAFPVSVFSDLWSEELRKVAGFETDSQDYRDGEEDERLERRSLSDSSQICHSSTRFQMEPQDLKDLLHSVKTIQEHQRTIECILDKYKLSNEECHI